MDNRPPSDRGDDFDADDDAIDRVLEAEFEITSEQEAELGQDFARFQETRQGYAWDEVPAWLPSVGSAEELTFPSLRTRGEARATRT